MIWIIISLIYIASAIAWYYSVRYLFTHKYKTIKPTWFEVAITFIPFVNTMWAFLSWAEILIINYKRRKSYKNKYLAAKFFKVL